MTRRIVLTILTLIVALLGLIAVPLGLITAGQDRRDFTGETVTAAQTLASAAEEKLADRADAPALSQAIARLQRSGDQVALYERAGTRLAGSGPVAAAAGVRRVLSRSVTASYPGDDRLVVLAPVLPDEGGRAIGVIALSRSTAPLQQRITALWIWLAAISAAGLLAAAAVAVALVRWVSRPLVALDAAARRLGDGALDTRSPVESGPTEVRRLATNFNTMAGRLEALVDGHQAMMADVSHQLRTPLAALRLRLDVLAQDAGEAVAGDLAGAQEEVARLSRLVNGLLAVARAENVVAEPVTVAADVVIRDRTAAWHPAAEERGVTLDVNVEPVGVRAGDGQLEQILDNLLANALDAVPAGGKVWVSARAAGPRARIVVADDGPGMTAQQQRSAFRRFASTTPGGTGLGLAIVHRLVTSNGGSAALSDSPGGGLTVTLELPSAPRDRGLRRSAPGSS
jgi:signal transduction histidine kinase